MQTISDALFRLFALLCLTVKEKTVPKVVFSVVYTNLKMVYSVLYSKSSQLRIFQSSEINRGLYIHVLSYR